MRHDPPLLRQPGARGTRMPKSAASTRSTSSPSESSRTSRVPSGAVTVRVRPVSDRWESGVVRWAYTRRLNGERGLVAMCQLITS